jgi:hypothetical protein
MGSEAAGYLEAVGISNPRNGYTTLVCAYHCLDQSLHLIDLPQNLSLQLKQALLLYHACLYYDVEFCGLPMGALSV